MRLPSVWHLYFDARHFVYIYIFISNTRLFVDHLLCVNKSVKVGTNNRINRICHFPPRSDVFRKRWAKTAINTHFVRSEIDRKIKKQKNHLHAIQYNDEYAIAWCYKLPRQSSRAFHVIVQNAVRLCP